MKKVLLLLLCMLLSFTLATSAFATDNYEPNNSIGSATYVDWYTVVYDINMYYWYGYSEINSYLSSSTDEDWFHINADGWYAYDFIDLISPPGYDYDAYVYDHNGVLHASMTASTTKQTIAIPSSIDKSLGFYIKVVSKNGLFDLNDNYHLDVYEGI